MESGRNSSVRAGRVLAHALEGALHRRMNADVAPDGTVRVDNATAEVRFEPLWVGAGFPADVRRALTMKPNLTPRQVLVADRMSDGAQKILNETGINWADADGVLNIVTPSFAIVAAPPRPRREKSESLWSPSAVVVAECILDSCEGPGARLQSTVELARGAGTSAGFVSRILSKFDDEGWTRKVGASRGPSAGRRLVEPGGMLSSWAQHVGTERRTGISLQVDSRSAKEAFSELTASLPVGAWAVTGWLGLERLAAFATSTPTYEAYIDAEIFDHPDLKRSMASHGTVVADGGRVTFYRGMEKRQRNIWRTGVDGATVSLPRLYADLMRSGVRGRDAAEHLRETRMRF